MSLSTEKIWILCRANGNGIAYDAIAIYPSAKQAQTARKKIANAMGRDAWVNYYVLEVEANVKAML